MSMPIPLSNNSPNIAKASLLKSEDVRDSYHMVPKLQWTLLIGCLLVMLYAVQFHPAGEALRIAAIGITAGGATLLLGFLTGFVFCIPRAAKSLQKSEQTLTSDAASSGQKVSKSSFEDNSNLVDISDWLTKILVGAGLVELNKIPHALWTLCSYLSAGLRTCDSTSCVAQSQVFALAIILFFFPSGFLIGYLWTRLYYQKALSDLVVENAALSVQSTARQLTYDALTQMNTGKLQEALKSIDQALSFDPHDGRAAFEKARILKKLAMQANPIDMNLLRESLAYASQAVSILPDNSSARYNLACYQNLLGYVRTTVIENLKLVFDADPNLKFLANEDPDLASIRQEPAYKEL